MKVECPLPHILEVNAHLHTPYSFSAFSRLENAAEHAAEEGVSIIGINDFFTASGYKAWKESCAKNQVIPMFNMEFICLDAHLQKEKRKINDPANPGRVYLSAKAMRYPFRLDHPYDLQLQKVADAQEAHVHSMGERMNQCLSEIQAPFRIDFAKVKEKYCKGAVRERHLARALRELVDEFVVGKTAFYAALFARQDEAGLTKIRTCLSSPVSLENEIRASMLKAGGRAFVEEKDSLFMSVEQALDLIRNAGGLATYPFLADDQNGAYTDFEQDLPLAADQLVERGIYSVEFIPGRNSAALLEKYANYLWNRGFLVTFGSEHNSPKMEPVKLSTSDGNALSENLRKMNYMSACVLLAHQRNVALGKEVYGASGLMPSATERLAWVESGDLYVRKCLHIS